MHQCRSNLTFRRGSGISVFLPSNAVNPCFHYNFNISSAQYNSACTLFITNFGIPCSHLHVRRVFITPPSPLRLPLAYQSLKRSPHPFAMDSTPIHVKKKRSGLVRTVTGLFGNKSPCSPISASTESIPPPKSPLSRRPSIFKRVLKRQSNQAISVESLHNVKGWTDPLPEYSLLSDSHSHRSRQTGDHSPAHGRSRSNSPLPTSIPGLRYVDEVEAAEKELDQNFHLHSGSTEPIPETIPEARPSQDDDDESDRPRDRTKRNEAHFPMLSEYLNKYPKHHDTDIKHEDSRISEFSDGSFDIHQPTPIRASFLQSGNATTSSPTSLTQAIYHENAQQLETARIARLDADYAYALDLQAQEGLHHRPQPQASTESLPAMPTQPLPTYLSAKPETTASSSDSRDNFEEGQEQWALMFTKSCQMCHERLTLFEFPTKTPTNTCEHENTICAYCLRRWIMGALETKGWTGVWCPECGVKLGHDDVMKGVLMRV